MASNLWNWLIGSSKSREQRDTLELLSRVRSAYRSSPLYPEDRLNRFRIDLIFEICERLEITPSDALGEALWSTIGGLLSLEGFSIQLPESDIVEKLTMEEGVMLRASLHRHLRFLSNHERLLPIWREKVARLFVGTLGYFPLSAFTDVDEKGVADDDSIILPEAKAYDLCDNVPEVVERSLVTFYDQDVVAAELFQAMRERIDSNLVAASGIPYEKRHETSPSKVVLPTKQVRKSPEYLVDAYLQGTPLRTFFESPLPFAIPFPARFEHTHIVGGTGHGKTQLMQFLINHDLVRAQQDGRSVVVLDSQGDLLRTISRLGYFGSSTPNSLADRFVLVDPNDVEYPACLNMFDFKKDRLSGYAPVDREKILNATVELYEYFFGALLGAELTQRQGLIFRYLARLMIEIPDATIHTLRELMEDSERFRPYMEKLQGTAKNFFETRFFDRQFNETKKQILTRLWGVLSNASLERMFSHSRSKIDLFELMNGGKIVLINTAKDLLGQEGSAIFGRLFIALIAQAAIQRAALPPHKRNPAFVYIDEAQDYFDDNISHLLNQARKYRVGLIFAHQNLDQLQAGLRSSVLSSTSIKLAGGVSAKDARTLDTEMRCEPEFLLAQRKDKKHTEFACYVRSFTNQALSVRIPLGYVEAIPTLDREECERLLDENRDRYSAPPETPLPTPPPTPAVRQSPAAVEKERPIVIPASELVKQSGPSAKVAQIEAQTLSPERLVATAAPKDKSARARREPSEPGRGGRQHKYLQHLVKQLAEERGFRATIEETILGGTGRVDVSLARGKLRAAFQISVTTGRDQELGNIEKCFAADYSDVVLVGASERHVKMLAKFIEGNLEEKDRGKVRYIHPDVLVECLEALPEAPPQEERTVRGYKVKVTQKVLDSAEMEARRKTIAGVIARSLNKSKG